MAYLLGDDMLRTEDAQSPKFWCLCFYGIKLFFFSTYIYQFPASDFRLHIKDSIYVVELQLFTSTVKIQFIMFYPIMMVHTITISAYMVSFYFCIMLCKRYSIFVLNTFYISASGFVINH